MKYKVIHRDDFLAQRTVAVTNAEAEALAHPEMNMIVVDAGDEIICDLCNAEIEELAIFLCSHGVCCRPCREEAECS